MGMPETTKPLVVAQLSAAVNKPLGYGALRGRCGPMSGVRGCGWVGMLWCGANRRLRRWERTTTTALRRSTAFRAQGRREMKQVMRPAQRGIVAPRRGGVWGGLPGFCSASDRAQVRESPSAALGTRYSDVIET